MPSILQSILIRPIKDDEVLGFAALIDKAAEEEDYFTFDGHVVLDGLKPERNADEVERHFLGIFIKDEMIGTTICGEDYHDITNATFDGMYVLPPFRGHGITGKIYEVCLGWAEEKDFLAAHVDIHPANEPSIKWAKRFGFEFVAQTCDVFSWGNGNKSLARAEVYRKALK